MKFQVDRTRELFRTGYQLHNHLQRDFRLEFSAITAGGLSVLDAIEALDYDTLTVRPTVSRSTKVWIMLKIIARTLIGMTPVPTNAFVSRSVR